MLQRCLSLRLIVALASLGVLALAVRPAPSAALPPAGDDLKDISNWSELMPEPVFTKIMEESVKTLQEKTRSPSEFNRQAKSVTNEAYSLILLAEVARRANEGDMAQKAVFISTTAKELAAAAKSKDLETSKKLVTALAGFKKVKEETKPLKEPLQELVPVHNLMEQVEVVNKEMKKYRRMKEADLKAKNKSEEVTRNTYRLTAYSVGITAHVPDKDIPKGKSKEDWLKATEDLRKATLEIAAAAKAKNQKNLRDAIDKMDRACTKCHDDFRVDAK